METLKPMEPAAPWNDKNLYERVDQCRFMLRVHGFLSDAESDRVTKRIDKWLAMHGMQRAVK